MNLLALIASLSITTHVAIRTDMVIGEVRFSVTSSEPYAVALDAEHHTLTIYF